MARISKRITHYRRFAIDKMKILIFVVMIFLLGGCIYGLYKIDKRTSVSYNERLMEEGDDYCGQFNKRLSDIELFPIWKKPTFICRNLRKWEDKTAQ